MYANPPRRRHAGYYDDNGNAFKDGFHPDRPRGEGDDGRLAEYFGGSKRGSISSMDSNSQILDKKDLERFADQLHIVTPEKKARESDSLNPRTEEVERVS